MQAVHHQGKRFRFFLKPAQLREGRSISSPLFRGKWLQSPFNVWTVYFESGVGVFSLYFLFPENSGSGKFICIYFNANFLFTINLSFKFWRIRRNALSFVLRVVSVFFVF